jgi:hypothetical protein
MFARRIRLIALSAVALAASVAPLAAQPVEGQARDVFRASSTRFGRTPPASTASQGGGAAKAATQQTAQAAQSTPARSAQPETAKAAAKAPAKAPAAAQKSSSGPAEGATAILASTSAADSDSLEPLGLRYSIVKQTGPGETREVDSDTVFRSGDRIKLQVQSSDHAHLYLVLKGSSGRWKVLFPTPEIAGGNNRIEPETTYMVPSNDRAWFSFDDQVGTEQLFILLSRQPQGDLEQVIHNLRRGASPAATPATPPSVEDSTKIMMASNQRDVDDTVIAGIRQTAYARDLVFEKVEDDEVEPDWTKAVYVVDKNPSPDSRIVADVKLEHR